MRIDKLLWFLRLAGSRSLAQDWAAQGHMRRNGRRIDRAHQKVEIGDVLTVFTPGGVRVIEILTLPERRGPASEAQACYRTLDAHGVNLIAAQPNEPCLKEDLQS